MTLAPQMGAGVGQRGGDLARQRLRTSALFVFALVLGAQRAGGVDVREKCMYSVSITGTCVAVCRHFLHQVLIGAVHACDQVL